MFSGIIEQVGLVADITKTSGGANFSFLANDNFLLNTQIGDSIAVNGVCLTVVKINQDIFSADLSNETLSLTTFNNAKINTQVNLEHSLSLNKLINGHLVSGHVDCLAEVVEVNNLGDNTEFKIKVPANLSRYIVKKGSITINGISLTINEIINNIFSINIIPHTMKTTNLGFLSQGDMVNVEIDLIARYLEKLIKQ